MTFEEVESKFGKYHRQVNKERLVRFYETIGDNYRIIDNKDHTTRWIILPDLLVEQLKKEFPKTIFSLSTVPVICFKTESEYAEILLREEKRRAEEKKTTEPEPCGIYCIKYQGEIIYIGMTQTSFKQRWQQHKTRFAHPQQNNMLLYHVGLKYEDLQFKIMVDFNQLQADRPLTTRDYKAMEMGFIACFKPRLNVSGVKIPYRF